MSTTLSDTDMLQLSKMAEGLVGSEIIKLAGNVKTLQQEGHKVHNLTIGDFDPKVFPIPEELKEEIKTAYDNAETNYPAANGMLELREAISAFVSDNGGPKYDPAHIQVSSGARPLIHAVYQVALDPGEKVIFPVPSWNNNHYSHLAHADQAPVLTRAEHDFMPTASDLAPLISNAGLVSICSPLNPTGTMLSKNDLSDICDLILQENEKRAGERKPVYLLYDQIYWTLTFGTEHSDPVSVRPEMRAYTILIDGMSKGFAATGVRVGWAMGPEHFINKMRAVLGHIGAWAPKPEQMATARYLNNKEAVSSYLDRMRMRISERLDGFYNGFMELKKAGHSVDAIAPQAAIYLTVRFELIGKHTAEGNLLENTEDITAYLLNNAGVALVPFYAFGAPKSSTWYRLSVGTVPDGNVPEVLNDLRRALEELN